MCVCRGGGEAVAEAGRVVGAYTYSLAAGGRRQVLGGFTRKAGVMLAGAAPQTTPPHARNPIRARLAVRGVTRQVTLSIRPPGMLRRLLVEAGA